jgi:proteasome lid subunit RPN8/RPN11
VPRPIVAEMLAHARAELPNECCGLLAGQFVAGAGGAAEARTGRVVRRYPLVNAAASPREYLSDERSTFTAFKDMHRLGLDWLAVYHSHPTSEPVPSPTDLARSDHSTGVVNFIISLVPAEPEVRGWWLTDSDYRESEWEQID